MDTPKVFRILYVTKSEDDCLLLRTLLDFPYIEITLAKTAADALEQVQNAHFNLYLLETRLPDGDGFELCRKLRDLTPNTPIVFYTGDAGKVFEQKGLAAGANAYLAKPYLDSLTSTIGKIISPR